jgi:hypothetical protein
LFWFCRCLGISLSFFGDFVDAWEQKLKSLFLMMLWDLRLDFQKFLDNLFGSMDDGGLISKRLYGFLRFYQYNMEI